MKRYLVVANQTAAGPALMHTVAECIRQGECSFTLVVPATHPRDQITWSEGTAHGLARRRLEDSIEQFRSSGADVEGWVGDENPYQAIMDAVADRTFDEIIVSTFPRGISRWLRMDLVSRVRAHVDIPVRVVESDRVPIQAS